MKKSCLTPGEFELMEILWPLGEASVKDIWTRVNPSRALAYTTVMTVLDKMHRKGILTQRKKGKAFFYSAVLSREEALKGVIGHICDAYFKGSCSDLAGFIHAHPDPHGAVPPAVQNSAENGSSQPDDTGND